MLKRRPLRLDSVTSSQSSDSLGSKRPGCVLSEAGQSRQQKKRSSRLFVQQQKPHSKPRTQHHIRIWLNSKEMSYGLIPSSVYPEQHTPPGPRLATRSIACRDQSECGTSRLIEPK